MSQIFQRPEKDQASSVPSTQETLEQGIDPTTLDILTDEEKQQLLKSLENL